MKIQLTISGSIDNISNVEFDGRLISTELFHTDNRVLLLTTSDDSIIAIGKGTIDVNGLTLELDVDKMKG